MVFVVVPSVYHKQACENENQIKQNSPTLNDGLFSDGL